MVGPVLWAIAALCFPAGGFAQTRAATEDEVKRAFDNHDVIPITKRLLAGLKKGLTREIALRKEFKQGLARYRTPEQYRECESQQALTPEGQKILELMTRLPANATAADIQRLSEKMNEELRALTRKNCGGDILEDWPESRRAEKLAAIEAEAAAAVDPGADSPWPAPDRGPSAGDGAGARGIGLGEYRILKERLLAYCAIIGPVVILRTVAAETDLAAPGEDAEVFWVFLKSELTEIGNSCDDFFPLLEELEEFS
jgi:hypothetical protein